MRLTLTSNTDLVSEAITMITQKYLLGFKKPNTLPVNREVKWVLIKEPQTFGTRVLQIVHLLL